MKYLLRDDGTIEMEPREDDGTCMALMYTPPRKDANEWFWVNVGAEIVRLSRPQFEEFVEQAIWLRANADAVEKDGVEVKEWQ